MTRRALALLSLIAALGTLPAAWGFVRMWQEARPVVCDVYAMPATVAGECLTWVSLMRWGAE